MIILLMGVSGAGKTAVGSGLAGRLGVEFIDSDDLHSDENVRKMAAGIPLTDVDRRPWLGAIRSVLEKHATTGAPVVVACSALKESYRQLLLEDLAEVKLVYLQASRKILESRLANRKGHFFDPGLLDSQLATLEEPAEAIVVDTNADLDAIIQTVQASLEGLPGTERR
jgi:gluconokinase